MTISELYAASPIKRKRATKSEMAERASFLINYAHAHGPITVRGIYYQAEVAAIPGIDKSDGSYDKIQRQVLNLRRGGRLRYRAIADLTRWMRKPASYDGVEEAVEECARLYRKALWRDADCYVEVWCEKDALAGVIYPVTSKFDVPLMVARGFASETFCYEAIAQREGDDRDYVVYYLGDFDRSGQDAARSLEEKLRRFGDEENIPVYFRPLAVTFEQIGQWNLPTRAPKRETAADRNWPYDVACELDAIEPDRIRSLVHDAIERHLPQAQYETAKIAEESERSFLKILACSVSKGDEEDDQGGQS
jgi:hypothetical protein